MFKDVSGDWRSDSLGATHLTLKETIYPQVNSSINRDIITSLSRSSWAEGRKLYKAAAKIAPRP